MEKEIKNIDPVGELKSKLWNSANLLRGSISITDFHFILYLLTLRRINLLDKVSTAEPEDIKNKINSLVSKNQLGDPNLLQELHEYFEQIMYDISDDVIYKLVELFQEFNQKILDEHFPEIFDDFLFRLNESLGKFGGESLLPKEVSRFIMNLAELPNYSSVYNPFAGLASFGVLLNDTSSYFGQEKNQTTWALGMLRIMACEKENNSHFVCDDSLENWGYESTLMAEVGENSKFDLVVANPPFGFRLPNVTEGKFGTIKTAEHFFIEKGIDELNPQGKLIAVVSLGLLFRAGAEQNLRQYVIENDLIEAVISLPGGLLPHTMIPFGIIVLNKSKENKGVACFINGNEFVKGPRNNKILDDKGLLENIKNKDFQYIRSISNEEIIRNDFNLSVPRYFKNVFDGVYLRDLIKPIRGQKTYEIPFGTVVKIKDLRDDKFNYKFDPNLNQQIQALTTEQVISQSCLLISSVGENIKPTYFNYISEPIYVSSNIFAFYIDEEKIDIDYLINELYADSSIEQLNSFQIGTGIPKLRKDDFLSILIEFPSLEEQKAKVKGLKEEHIKNKESQLILERELLGLKDDAFREFASIKHTFRQYLNSLKSNVAGTRKFILNNTDQNITINSIYSNNINRTLGEHLISLEGTIDSMSMLLTSADEQIVTSRPIEVDLIELIKEAQSRFTNNEIFHFENLHIDLESFSQDGDGQIAPIIQIDPEDFYRIFSNIISNAVDHGFKNKVGNNLIRTSLSFDAENLYCILEVSNNGKKMAPSFTVKHLTTRGEKTTDSTGAGIGGADIKSILDKYQGTVTLKNENESTFPVTYEIGLPIVVFEI